MAVLHCGDIGSPDIPPLLANWPTHYVCGNVDSQHDQLESAIIQAGGIYHHQFGDITFGEFRIALLHSHISRSLENAISSGLYDIVCYGHTHRSEIHHDEETIVLNPGALYRAAKHTIAILDLKSNPPKAWHIEI